MEPLMLIRNAQWAAFREARLAALIDRLTMRAARHPALPREELREQVARLVARGLELGLSREEDFQRLTGAACILGFDFEAHAGPPAELIADDELDPTTRVERLLQLAKSLAANPRRTR